MAYIGKKPSDTFRGLAIKDSFTGDGSTVAFDLTKEAPDGGDSDLEIFIDNVRQEGGTGKAYTLGVDGSGDNKRITFTAAPDSGAEIYIINPGKAYADTKLGNVSVDSTPSLGGDLDVNGNDIVSVSNGDINITPNGTGEVVIDGLIHPQADGNTGEFLKTDGAGNLDFAAIQGGNITTEGEAFSNYNQITDDRTTTTSATSNMFLAGLITVADTKTWTVAGAGTLTII